MRWAKQMVAEMVEQLANQMVYPWVERSDDWRVDSTAVCSELPMVALTVESWANLTVESKAAHWVDLLAEQMAVR